MATSKIFVVICASIGLPDLRIARQSRIKASAAPGSMGLRSSAAASKLWIPRPGGSWRALSRIRCIISWVESVGLNDVSAAARSKQNLESQEQENHLDKNKARVGLTTRLSAHGY